MTKFQKEIQKCKETNTCFHCGQDAGETGLRDCLCGFCFDLVMVETKPGKFENREDVE